MQHLTQDDSGGFWRDASRPVTLMGIPLPFTLIYLLWCPFPSVLTLELCSLVIAGFVVLDYFGWRLVVLLQRLVYRFHGPRAAGRPWWYRRFTETPRDFRGL